MNKTVAIIGGGAAGLMAAYQAARNGARVWLFERNPNLARKILISGKGRCNLTNIKNIEGFIENIPGNGKFLYKALSRFSNTDLIAFFDNIGLKTKVERGGRVFPVTDKSLDVVKMLERAILDAGVSIRYNNRVKQLIIEKDCIRAIKLFNDEDIFYCDSVVVATGGLSYPSTGSTGDGYELARQAGHTVTPLMPSLVPLITGEEWIKQLQGLNLKNIEVAFYLNSKKKKSIFGEMIFTHFGVSGPAILTLSRDVVEHLGKQIQLSINLKPALDWDKLSARLERELKRHARKKFKNSLDDLLPQKMIPVFINLCQINPEKTVNQITREEKQRILKNLSDLRISIIGCRRNEAIVTRGGVSVKEIDPKTMESKLIKGLFFAGEVIDVDGLTGGYNLQAAFSTGWLAGMNAAGN
ncbi:MAG: NAD(P)/FAD-dependent oxidoreductase [Tepidanaerobacteraceae bacterium]|jgi:predicted Rossmann fold flavoprotein|nr:NAD(P)/FAD-dependent oxidoreductase [Tepidanaerobacteraceae bacterium]